MKTSIYRLFALAAVFTVWSCEEQVNITPFDQLDAGNVFSTVADLEQGINGLYASHSPQAVITWSIFTDDTKIGADNGGQQVTFHNWILNSSSGQATGIWANRYSVINTANRILEAAAEITPEGDEEQAAYNQYTGECYAWRAFAHFELLQFFSMDYNSSTLAVPYVTTVNVFEQPARETVGEVFTKIKEDISTARGLLSAIPSSTNRISLDFLTALEARMALYEGDNATAISKADELIAKYPLADVDQYEAMFADTDETEVIFKATRTQNDAFAGGVWYFTGTGGAFIEASSSMLDAIFENGGGSDVRPFVILDVPNSDLGSNFLLIGKYLGKEGFNYLNDFKIFRVSEMYLIKAEAQARQGDFAGCAASIDALRDARSYAGDVNTPTPGSLLEAINVILFQRRLELAYEGHRYLDVKRTRDITNTGFNRSDADCGGGTPCILAADDHRFTLPIPAQELDANPNIAPQNDGYN